MVCGLVAKLRWHGKVAFHEWSTLVGIVCGVLFWLPIMILVPFILKTRRRTTWFERTIGFCAHHDPFFPYCAECERKMKEGGDRVVEESDGHLGQAPEELVDLTRADVEAWIEKNPECRRCKQKGALYQYLGSLWVICAVCGRRTFTFDPSLPEDVDRAPPFTEWDRRR